MVVCVVTDSGYQGIAASCTNMMLPRQEGDLQCGWYIMTLRDIWKDLKGEGLCQMMVNTNASFLIDGDKQAVLLGKKTGPHPV
ncbi:hypothetical protein TSMEX_010478, partial [Taenia solium]